MSTVKLMGREIFAKTKKGKERKSRTKQTKKKKKKKKNKKEKRTKVTQKQKACAPLDAYDWLPSWETEHRNPQ